MTLAEREALVATFSGIVEDLISATNRRFYMNDGSVYPDDGRAETTANPWNTTAEVLAAIPTTKQSAYLTVNVLGVEYWFLPDGSLVPKVGSLALVDASVTLPKMANMATASVIYRKTSGSGPPEIQTLATLKTDLGIASTPADLSVYVLKATGYSLVSDTLIAQIHAPGSDTPDLTEYVTKAAGERLITEAEVLALSAMSSTISITLPGASSILTRVSLAVEGVNYPTGWQIASLDTTLEIDHTLTGKHIAGVNVFELDGYSERLLIPFNTAYSGVLIVGSSIYIEGLAPTDLSIRIELLFN